jgi:hypothetical protein
MKKLLILLILMLTPFLADARGLMMMGGGVAAAGGSCSSGTADITQSTANGTYDGANVMGQTFTPTTNITIYSFTFTNGNSTSATLTCRIGVGADLSSTYLEEITGISASDGAMEIVWNTHHSLATGTIYSVICSRTAGTWNPWIATSDVYMTENYDYCMYFGESTWAPGPNDTRDITFTLKKCN